MKLKFVFLFLVATSLFCQPSYEISCIKVNANGSINIGFNPNPIALGDGLVITGENGYSQTATVATVSFLDNINDGNTSRLLYQMSRTVGATTTPSNSYYSIKLSANLTPNNIVNLNWNNPTSHWPAPNVYSYEVYKEYPAGTWTKIATTSSPFYDDALVLPNTCTANFKYQVKIVAPSCTWESSIVNVNWLDLQGPSVINIINTNVNFNSGNAELNWQPSTAPDAFGYVIYKNINGSWNTIDTIKNSSTTYYEYLNSQADTKIEDFRVAVLDKCYNTSPMSMPHNTILLSFVGANCNASFNLSWNNYAAFSSPSYLIMGYNSQTSTWESITQITSLLYTVNSVIYSKLYIKAIENGVESNSNIVDISALIPMSLKWLDIDQVSIEKENLVINFTKDSYCEMNPVSMALQYSVQKLNGNNFESIYNATQNISIGQTQTILNFNDGQYRIAILDNCGNNLFVSDTVRPLIIKVEDQGLGHQISWDKFSIYNYNKNNFALQKYYIYKTINSIDILIDSVSSTETNYINTKLNSQETDICYFIVAKAEGVCNSVVNVKLNRSSQACINQEPVVYVPNAFSPNSDALNEGYKPVTAANNLDNYSFQVFNRWGELIFTTNKQTEAFDGNNFDEGVYYSVLSYTFKGKQKIVKNKFLLLR